MKKYRSFRLFFVLMISICLSGCGKEKDPQTTQVLQISVTPAATPTPTPKVISASAITTSGELTMVNEYRVSKDTSAAAAQGTVNNQVSEQSDEAAEENSTEEESSQEASEDES